MSEPQDSHHGDDHRGHHADHTVLFPQGTRQDYVTGFILAVILTAIPFFLVMSGVFSSPRLTAFLVLICAVAQIIVHMVYFLHMSPRTDGGWTVISLVFTVIVLVIAVVGTVWVMYNMDANMMPGMMTEPPAP